MENVQQVSQKSSVVAPTFEQLQQVTTGNSKQVMFKKVKGGLFLVIGYLLSPLCWWNDLVFNLPIAYFFGYICSFISPKLLLPCSIIGYWLSNIVGILLMQVGALDVLQNQPQEHSLKKELFTGLVSSTVYTLVILALIQFKILDAPALF
ncbi:MAG: hypothetical protein PUP91_34090 [Rhizonema sp. PD37]|nr:hypothetical protein [Rhizonema sp. PD37]